MLTQPVEQVSRAVVLLNTLQKQRRQYPGEGRPSMTVKGSCHCGATQFTIAKRPAHVTRCTCSFCSKRGTLWAYQEREGDFSLITARDRVSTYQWGNYQIEHHHCSVCGCGTWSRAPQWDQQAKRPIPGKFRVQVNAWLLEDFDLDAQPVEVIDGKNLW